MQCANRFYPDVTGVFIIDNNFIINDFDIESFDRFESEILEIASDVSGEYWLAENFRREIPGKWVLSFFVSHKNRPIGYAISSLSSPRSVHLHHLMVHQDWRGKGCGEFMLRELERRSADLRMREITLKVASEGKAAKRFYERNGFELNGSADGYDMYGKTL